VKRTSPFAAAAAAAALLAVSTSAAWNVRARAQSAPPAPLAPVVPEADGYVPLLGAAVPPDAKRAYRAVFDATRAAPAPDKLAPALNMAGAGLNTLGAGGVPPRNARFVVVFHGAALDAVLDDAHYRAKHGVANPNLKALARLRKAGVALYACGQNLAAENIDRKALCGDVTVASDALLVLIAYQNDGYALMSY